MPDDIQYMVRDPQGNMYGPATMPTIGQWVREGRITALMQIAPEASLDWLPAAAYPELQNMFTPEQIAAATGKSPTTDASPQPTSSTPADPSTNPYAATVPTMVNYQTPAASNRNTLALISMIAGIVGVVMFCPSCCMCALGIPSDVAAIVMGVLARGQLAKNPGQEGERMAKAGIILGIIGLSLSLIITVIYFVFAIGNFRAGAFR